MSENFDYLGGEIGEATSYTPVPAGRYQAKIVKGEMVDPVAMKWEPRDELTAEEREEYLRPYPRVRWQIEALENGDATEYAGRILDQRLSLRSGANPKTGQSYAKPRADLLRLANGLGPKDEPTGLRLLDINTTGLDREEAVATATAGMAKYEGLKGVVRVINSKNQRSGEMKDSVVGIVLK